MLNNFFDLKLNQENIKLLPEPKGETRNFLILELLNKNGVQLSETSYYGNVVMKHNLVYTIGKDIGHTDFYGLLDNNVIDVNTEADRLLQENPEANSVIFYLLRIELDEYKEPETSNLITGSKSRNRRNFAYFMDTYREAPKYEIEKLITAIYPKLEGFHIRHRGIIEELYNRNLSTETKNFLELFSLSIGRLIEKYVETCLIDGEKEVLDKILSSQGELNKEFLDTYREQKPKRNILDIVEPLIAIKPELISLNHTDFSEALTSFKPTDFKENPEIPGMDIATKVYQAGYYPPSKSNLSKKRFADNTISLHKTTGEELLSKTDFNELTEYIDIEIPENFYEKEKGIILDRSNDEVFSGITTGFLFLQSQFPDVNFKETELVLSLEDIAVCMGYRGLTPALKLQIISTLLKAEKLRITHEWKNEAEARGVIDDYKNAINMYGDTIKYDKTTSKLINFEFVRIKNPKAPNKLLPGRQKNREAKDYEGKLGIRFIKIPAFTVYPIVTNQTINIPAEWLNIPKTGQSPNLKRIKWEICRRIKNLLHFAEIRERSNNKKKHKMDVYNDKGNFEKVVIDDLLTDIGGYDLTPLTLKDYVEIKDKDGKPVKDENGIIEMRPATIKDIKKRESTNRAKRARAMNYIDNFINGLKKIIPNFKGIEREYKNGRMYAFYLKIE